MFVKMKFNRLSCCSDSNAYYSTKQGIHYEDEWSVSESDSTHSSSEYRRWLLYIPPATPESATASTAAGPTPATDGLGNPVATSSPATPAKGLGDKIDSELVKFLLSDKATKLYVKVGIYLMLGLVGVSFAGGAVYGGSVQGNVFVGWLWTKLMEMFDGKSTD